MRSREKIVERELGVRLPEDYKLFLRTRGIYEYPGGEVYGITEDIIDLGKIPCVVGATRNARKLYGLPNHYVVIAYTGFEDEMVCLDTPTGQVYVLSLGEYNKIADSFDEWFSKEIIGR